ncbi:uncharacterized protein LOC128190120 [Crassostrea angulata]|uniref:uncharacterized protein LOC128190120 n=1 Tax=Magallana angulata TaxID=2784310 RepID=UPI0022B0901A|nr:uncharacterized protein LOC128190120 [Crassostrea angulata]
MYHLQPVLNVGCSFVPWVRVITNMYIICLCVGLFAISSAYVNVALNKPAYQQNQWKPDDDTYDASNAVDGRKSDLTWNGGQCAVSAARELAIWWVNLTSVHNINHITIYFLTGRISGHILTYLGFSLYISNTTDRLQGIQCFKDANFTPDTMPSVFNITCPVHGQYVIYYNERVPGFVYPYGYQRSVEADLCEVEVYGCSIVGKFYGADCCPDVNCLKCHMENGTCEECDPGFQGDRCEQGMSDVNVMISIFEKGNHSFITKYYSTCIF